MFLLRLFLLAILALPAMSQTTSSSSPWITPSPPYSSSCSTIPPTPTVSPRYSWNPAPSWSPGDNNYQLLSPYYRPYEYCEGNFPGNPDPTYVGTGNPYNNIMKYGNWVIVQNVTNGTIAGNIPIKARSMADFTMDEDNIESLEIPEPQIQDFAISETGRRLDDRAAAAIAYVAIREPEDCMYLCANNGYFLKKYTWNGYSSTNWQSTTGFTYVSMWDEGSCLCGDQLTVYPNQRDTEDIAPNPSWQYTQNTCRVNPYFFCGSGYNASYLPLVWSTRATPIPTTGSTVNTALPAATPYFYPGNQYYQLAACVWFADCTYTAFPNYAALPPGGRWQVYTTRKFVVLTFTDGRRTV